MRFTPFATAARQYWEQMARDLRPVYTALSEAAATERFTEFAETWGLRYPAILVTRSLDPTGKSRARWAIRWKPALNAFSITFAGRIVPLTIN